MEESDDIHIPCSSVSAEPGDSYESDPDTPPKKNKGYYFAFQDEWLTQQQYNSWLRKADNFTARFELCLVSFTVKHDSKKAVKTHAYSRKHQATCSAAKTNTLLTAYLPKKDNMIEFIVAGIEVASVYHSVVHCHSYNSCLLYTSPSPRD